MESPILRAILRRTSSDEADLFHPGKTTLRTGPKSLISKLTKGSRVSSVTSLNLSRKGLEKLMILEAY